MRKIEENIIAMIQNMHNMMTGANSGRVEKTIGNTRISCGYREDGELVTSVYLHDNLIAQNGVTGWGFCMAGWPTPTTKSRINSIAKAFGHAGVYTKGGKHYSGDKEVNAFEWF